MNERKTVGIERSENAPPGEPKELLGNVSVIKRTTGARMVWSHDRSELRVNTALFPNEDQARLATLRQVAGHIGLSQAIRTDADPLLKTTRQYPKASEPVLRWQGLALLRKSNANTLRDQPIAPQNQTLSQEFQLAIDIYVLTGKYPDQMSDAVSQAIRRIPQPKAKSLIDYIASGRYLNFDGKNYYTYLLPLINELAEQDRQTGQSQQFEYRPSQTQDIAGDKEPLQESAITARVTPFYGGYYREQVCRYDPVTRQIIKEAGIKKTWDIDDDLADEAVWKTRRTYKGTIQSRGETLIKLPYGALPIVSTLQPPGAFQLMRDDLGIVYLDPINVEGKTAAIGEFSFDFVLAEVPSNQLNMPPTERDSSSVGGNLDLDTQTLLDDLTSQTWMSDVQKAREIARFVRKKLRYPQDEEEIRKIDSLYLAAGNNLWTKIAETGIAHCYWANIFRDELCKRLGIASRIATGPYINSKDPRFEFAVVEAPGLDKHAWGEVWDTDKQVWTHRGMDATPPKAKDDSEDQDGESQPLDGDFGESTVDQPELSQEEIERLYDELSKQDETPPSIPTPEQLAAAQFEQEKGVAWREWHQLESWINGINRTAVPAEASIRHKPSTIRQEWRELFDLLYKRREVPHEAYKGPVRQSEGEFLDDPVTAYIDMLSREDDPLGYVMLYKKQRERIEVSVFEDDYILDISSSMSGEPADEQRKMALSSLYNIRSLNSRLNHSQNKNNMATPLSVRSRVAVFGDWTNVLQESTDTITEKGLVELDKVLKAHSQSSSGLRESLKQYKDSLDPKTIQKIREGGYSKVLTVVSDGGVTDQAGCITVIEELRALGIIVQGIGFGSAAQDIRVVFNDPTDPDGAVVIDDVRQATLVRHKLLMKHLSKL